MSPPRTCEARVGGEMAEDGGEPVAATRQSPSVKARIGARDSATPRLRAGPGPGVGLLGQQHPGEAGDRPPPAARASRCRRRSPRRGPCRSPGRRATSSRIAQQLGLVEVRHDDADLGEVRLGDGVDGGLVPAGMTSSHSSNSAPKRHAASGRSGTVLVGRHSMRRSGSPDYRPQPEDRSAFAESGAQFFRLRLDPWLVAGPGSRSCGPSCRDGPPRLPQAEHFVRVRPSMCHGRASLHRANTPWQLAE